MKVGDIVHYYTREDLYLPPAPGSAPTCGPDGFHVRGPYAAMVTEIIGEGLINANVFRPNAPTYTPVGVIVTNGEQIHKSWCQVP